MIETWNLHLPNGTKLGVRALDWRGPLSVVFKAILCVGLSAGFRKADMYMAVTFVISCRKRTKKTRSV